MNAMRGGAKTGWTAGLCPEPHGIPIFGICGISWSMTMMKIPEPMGVFSVLPRGELYDVRTSVRQWRGRHSHFWHMSCGETH